MPYILIHFNNIRLSPNPDKYSVLIIYHCDMTLLWFIWPFFIFQIYCLNYLCHLFLSQLDHGPVRLYILTNFVLKVHNWEKFMEFLLQWPQMTFLKQNICHEAFLERKFVCDALELVILHKEAKKMSERKY